MAQPKTIIVTIKGMIQESDFAELKKVSEVKYVELEKISQEELASLVKEYDYLMLNYDVVQKLDSAFWSHSSVKKLKGISCDMTGMGWANPQLAEKEGVLVMNTPGYSTESVAESILLETLLHSRKIHEAYKDMIRGEEPKTRKGFNLAGKTVGIIGLGNIGKRLTELFNGVGAKVIAWNRTLRKVSNVTSVSLKEVFTNSDVICLAIKTEKGENSTEEIVNKEVCNSAKKGQILINLASASLVNHDDLYDAIQAGRIAGYSATRNETLKKHKIASLDCVSLPPASAWMSDESLAELRRIWVENIISTIKGKPTNKVTG